MWAPGSSFHAAPHHLNTDDFPSSACSQRANSPSSLAAAAACSPDSGAFSGPNSAFGPDSAAFNGHHSAFSPGSAAFSGPDNAFAGPGNAFGGAGSAFGSDHALSSDALLSALLGGEAACQSLPGSAAAALGPDHLRGRLLPSLEGLGWAALGGPGGPGVVGGPAGPGYGPGVLGDAFGTGTGTGVGSSVMDGMGRAGFGAGLGGGGVGGMCGEQHASAGTLGAAWGLGVGSMNMNSSVQMASGSGVVGGGAAFGQPEGGAPSSASWSSHWFPQMVHGAGGGVPQQSAQLPSSSSGCVASTLGLDGSGSVGSGSSLLPQGLLEPAGDEGAWGAGFQAGQNLVLSAL